MAHVFRHSYTVLNKKTGQRETRYTKKWYVEYVDANGDTQRVAGYQDRFATDQMLARLMRDAARIQEGIIPADVQHVRTLLVDHLEDYVAFLRAKNNGADYIALTKQRIESVLTGCKFSRFSDLEPNAVGAHLARLRAPADDAPGLSIESSNHYSQAVKGFAGWVALRMKAFNPLAGLRKLNADVDRRHRRRALEPADFERLVQTTAASPKVIRGLTGPDRAMLYVTAAYTGLRARELRSLTPEQVQLAGEPPTLTVEAGYSKRRRLDTLPLAVSLAVRLTVWLRDRPARKPLWPGKWVVNKEPALILRQDLAAAKIPYADDRGRVFDFHALRSQFITSLARAGVPLVEAQKLARHSSPTLTSNYYTHLTTKDLAESLKRLPDAPQDYPKKPAKRKPRKKGKTPPS